MQGTLARLTRRRRRSRSRDRRPRHVRARPPPRARRPRTALVDLGLRDTTVQVPIAVAANVCGIAVDVLSGLTLTGPTTCDALAEATAGA